MSKNKMKSSIKFSISIAVITFVLAAIFSIVSSSLLNKVTWYFGFVIVFVIVLIGILFDILGIAPAAASEEPFHAMAAKKVKGAKESLFVVRNADRFASFCNDVIGDISGIVSGTALTVVLVQIGNILKAAEGSTFEITLSVVMTSILAALTVGGKALGKTFALKSSTQVVLIAGKVIHFLEHTFKMQITQKSKSKKRR
ncbi:MAG TPA: hypothetical protein IAA78_09895 [Candidatus Avamphibacillus intestinigallinarum]|nr:hypothetical protein [Candidatus Avamphibacillus intestinigallinarum]